MSLADLMRKGSLRAEATAIPATVATDDPKYSGTVAGVATVAVAGAPKVPGASYPIEDVDPAGTCHGCWPHDPRIDAAMNGAESDTMQARIALFSRCGVGADLAESLADKLVTRDREGDDRHLCLECARLSGQHCGRYANAGLLTAEVGGIRQMLQRCPGFTAAL